MIGFAILMYGMDFMSDSVSPLADMPEFTSMLTAFTNPLLGDSHWPGTDCSDTEFLGFGRYFAGADLDRRNFLWHGNSYHYGPEYRNLCDGSDFQYRCEQKNAKRVAVIHIAFNLLGTAVCLLLYFVLHFLVDLSFIEQAISPVGVAVVHSIFNITTTVLLLPFSKQLVKLAEGTIKTEPEKEIAFLDERLLKTPSIALQECNHITTDMAYVSKQSMMDAMDLLFSLQREKGRRCKRSGR